MKIKLIKIFILGAVLISCNNKKTNTLLELNQDSVRNLAHKFNASTEWDSVFQYTVKYQKEFIEEKELLLFKGRIYDIIENDSSYLLKILDERENSSQNFLATITCSKEQYNKVFDKGKSDAGAFVLQISKITSSNPSIKKDEGEDGDGNSYTYTHLSDDDDQMITIFYGKLIDFYLNEVKSQ